MIDIKDSLIISKEFSSAYLSFNGLEKEPRYLIDFSKFTSNKSKLGLTDIDGFIIHNNNLILLECKKEGFPVHDGQKMLLARIADMWNKKVGKCVVFKVEFSPTNKKQINLKEAKVTSVYKPSKPNLGFDICDRNAKAIISEYCDYFNIPKEKRIIETLDGMFECDSEMILAFSVSEDFDNIKLGVKEFIIGLSNLLEDKKKFLAVYSCLSIRGKKDIVISKDKPIFCLNETIPYVIYHDGKYIFHKGDNSIQEIVKGFSNKYNNVKLAQIVK